MPRYTRIQLPHSYPDTSVVRKRNKCKCVSIAAVRLTPLPSTVFVQLFAYCRSGSRDEARRGAKLPKTRVDIRENRFMTDGLRNYRAYTYECCRVVFAGRCAFRADGRGSNYIEPMISHVGTTIRLLAASSLISCEIFLFLHN